MTLLMLKPDPAEATRDILFIISLQLANSSVEAASAAAFSAAFAPEEWILPVNCLFFSSLTCSIGESVLPVQQYHGSQSS